MTAPQLGLAKYAAKDARRLNDKVGRSTSVRSTDLFIVLLKHSQARPALHTLPPSAEHLVISFILFLMDYKPPADPPPRWTAPKTFASNNPYRSTALEAAQDSKETKAQEYRPPPGRPPYHSASESEAPPAYDPWLAVPDIALLPPPPPLNHTSSPANNADENDAIRAGAWCTANPLWQPRQWTSQLLNDIENKHITPSAPPGTRSVRIHYPASRCTALGSSRNQGDVTILSNLPLYAALYHQVGAGEQRTIYYQVHIKNLSGADATIALGFVAPPFPPNRLPGWHRGSLAVHNDDGHRFVNDDKGGTAFVRPFGDNETVGLGMTFIGSQYDQPPRVRVFFTRNSQEESSWDLHESRDSDAQAGGVSGLDGTADLYAAIGICGGIEAEVDWKAF